MTSILILFLSSLSFAQSGSHDKLMELRATMETIGMFQGFDRQKSCIDPNSLKELFYLIEAADQIVWTNKLTPNSREKLRLSIEALKGMKL